MIFSPKNEGVGGGSNVAASSSANLLAAEEAGRSIEVQNLSYDYEGLPVLRDIHLSVAPGEGIAVLGPSGCGKSTLLHIIAGLLGGASGSVWYGDANKTGKPGWISYMQQQDLLMPWKNLCDNIALPLQIAGWTAKNARQRVRSELSQFGLEGFEKVYPGQLSGGMRQRASLMRACMVRGDYLLLDEPFSKLDFLTRIRMHQWFQEYASTHGTGFILVTHDPEEAVLLCDRIIVLGNRPASIAAEYRIDHPRPRDRSILSRPEIARLLDDMIAKAG